VILFNAEMGAGKTVFTKGYAQAMGITETVTSPTYTLLQEYTADNATLVHVDAWRMNSDEEIKGLQLEQYLRPGYVVAIEWAGALQPLFEQMRLESSATQNPIRFVDIEIDYTGPDTRHVTMHS